MKKILLLVLCLIMSACASLGPYSGDTTTETGVRYLLGRGVKKDDNKAFYYFSKAANEEDPFAENELAYLYAAGIGTPQNWQQSFFWYQKAAGHGLASAEYNTGLFYYYGLGGQPMDRSKALFWFKKAADRGFLPAKQIFNKNPIH